MFRCGNPRISRYTTEGSSHTGCVMCLVSLGCSRSFPIPSEFTYCLLQYRVSGEEACLWLIFILVCYKKNTWLHVHKHAYSSTKGETNTQAINCRRKEILCKKKALILKVSPFMTGWVFRSYGTLPTAWTVTMAMHITFWLFSSVEKEKTALGGRGTRQDGPLVMECGFLCYFSEFVFGSGTEMVEIVSQAHSGRFVWHWTNAHCGSSVCSSWSYGQLTKLTTIVNGTWPCGVCLFKRMLISNYLEIHIFSIHFCD